MANVLKMEKQILIQQLLALGWSYRQIEKETGIRRETVAKYDLNHPKNQACPRGQAKAANLPAESKPSSQNRPKHALSAAERCPPTTQPTRISHAARYDAIIQEKWGLGLTAQRIYQDLVVEHGFEHGYDSVKCRRELQKRPGMGRSKAASFQVVNCWDS